jgi:cytidylate kinase
MSKPPVITIDGPSGSGKGTIAKLVAKALKWHYLESGALYRVLAFVALKKEIQLDEVNALAEIAKNLPVRFNSNDESKVYWLDHDITDEIHTEMFGNLASKIAALPVVREALLARQRIFQAFPGLVTDGRDMGTIVFPDAELKFFLVASQEVRAKRRYIQLKQKGINVSLEFILGELIERDYRDQHRVVSPLKPASDAIIVDSTSLNIEQTFDQIMKSIRQALVLL